MTWTQRWSLTVVLLFGTAALLALRPQVSPPPQMQPLAHFPHQIAGWYGTDEPLSPAVVAALGADDHINRHYQRPLAPPVTLYVTYHANMGHGSSYHSPKNCLPASGWYYAQTDATRLVISSSKHDSVTTNTFVIQKGLEKQLMLYWYQDRGRILASEWEAKAYLVLDALRTARTDGALVRLTVPLTDTTPAIALREATAFAEHLIPLLRTYLP